MGPCEILDTAPSMTTVIIGVGTISKSVMACLWNGMSCDRLSGSVGGKGDVKGGEEGGECGKW